MGHLCAPYISCPFLAHRQPVSSRRGSCGQGFTLSLSLNLDALYFEMWTDSIVLDFLYSPLWSQQRISRTKWCHWDPVNDKCYLSDTINLIKFCLLELTLHATTCPSMSRIKLDIPYYNCNLVQTNSYLTDVIIDAPIFGKFPMFINSTTCQGLKQSKKHTDSFKVVCLNHIIPEISLDTFFRLTFSTTSENVF